ncbi:hypothetical protein [Cetobacterium somerae]|uniref:hypothetical protein n=1 Tax=Cetobacterium somerae TaxID=188913 RepID=UPI0038920092
MFVGFNLKINKAFFSLPEKALDEYKKIGENHLNEYKKVFESDLRKFIIEENTISGTKLQEEWFPQIDVNIFISHSHIDKDLALALAGWLNVNFKLNCFVDSSVWGYSDDLLESLNDKYSDKRKKPDGGNIYSYNSCNKVAQHVNMMLNVALHKMIDKTEAIILLNTSNSVEKFEDKEMNRTYSPWLYSELVCSQLIRKKPLENYRLKAVMESVINKQVDEQLKVAYEFSSEHLIDLSQDDLKNWKQQIPKSSILTSGCDELRLEKEKNLNRLYKLKELLKD